MSRKLAIKLRSKIIGVLLRDARIAAGKSMKELGGVIGVSSGRIGSIERGTRSPSLPELELLAYFLDTQIDHFWSEEIVSDDPHPSESLEAKKLLALRHRIIGAVLRQARNENNLSQKDLAKRTGISASRIRRYENGETPVPLPELEQLGLILRYDIESFKTKSGPVGDWLARQQAISKFLLLPKNLRDFVAEPGNHAYLEMAQRLSSMSPDRLKSVAEGLRELSE